MTAHEQRVNWKPLIVYLAVTFGFSWALWWPQAMVAQGLLPPDVEERFGWLFGYAPWGPLVGALVVSFIDKGLPGLKDLLARGVSVRHSWIWYAFALLLFPVLIGGSLVLAGLVGVAWPENKMLTEMVAGTVSGGAPPEIALPMTLVVGFFFIFFMGGPLQEEFGWRGILLPRLQHHISPLYASIVVGLIWGLWHLPLFYMPRQEMYYQHPLWGLLLSTTLVSVIMTGLFNRTRASIFMAILIHASFNWSHFAFPSLSSDEASLILFGLMGLVGAWLVWKQRMWERIA